MTFAHLLQAVSNLPPDASTLQSSISALESEIKALENSSVPWEHRLPWFTAMVMVGVAMELWVIFHERSDDMEAWAVGYVLGTPKLPGKPSRLKFLLEIASVLLITLGILGELGVGLKVASINGTLRIKSAELRSKSDQLLAVITQQAGDAVANAKIAHEESDAVGKETDAIEKRISAASRQLGQVEQDVIAQGPRWKLLASAAPELVNQLTPFAGQRVQLYVCGPQSAVESETMSTWGDIASVLEADGAKWKVEKGGLVFWEKCPSGQGIGVLVNKRAPTSTMRAAQALSDGLSKILPPSPEKILHVQDPDFLKLMVSNQSRFGIPSDMTAPYMVVGNDPDLIIVAIASHPQQQTNTPMKRTNKPKNH